MTPGVYSEQEIAKRILQTCVEADDHLIWQGGRAGEGYPVARLLKKDGKVAPTLLRPYIFSAMNGPSNNKISMACNVRLCLNPEHMEEIV